MPSLSYLLSPSIWLSLAVWALPVAAQGISVDERAELTAADAAEQEEFGRSIGFDGTTLVVGAHLDATTAPGAGAAYVFTRDGSGWRERAELLAPDGAADDRFGASVAVDGDTILVGAPLDDTAQGESTGAVYVFVRSGTSWSFQEKLLPGTVADGDQFGFAVALQGERAYIGAPFEDVTIDGEGALYVYRRTGSAWSVETQLFGSSANPLAAFGGAVAVDGTRLVVGARNHDGNQPTAGGAYVYDRSGTVWSESALLTASDGASSDLFGVSVTVEGETALIGASLRDSGRGAAYVYQRSASVWVEEQRLFAPAAFLFDQFGLSVELENGVAIVGDVLGPEGRGGGAVRVFERSAGVWQSSALVRASDAFDTPNGLLAPFFGWSVVAEAGTLVVSALRDDQAALDAGSVYVFDLDRLRFCNAADGATQLCPCANPGLTDFGCDLAQGTGGVDLSLVEQETGALNRVTLTGRNLPTQTAPAALVLRSGAPAVGGPAVFGDGVLCLATPLVRLGAAFGAGGTSIHTFGHGTMAGAGVAYYQLWFRNAPASFCDPAAAFNLSNGLTLVW